METAGTCQLPPPLATPLAGGSARFAPLSRRQRAMAEELLADADVFVVLATGTQVDVGSWWGASRLCVCALADQLVLFAPEKNPLLLLLRQMRLAGTFARPPRRHVERIPFSELHESTYNHVTGELVLSPAERARVRRLKIPPLGGYQLLAQIHHTDRETRHA